MIEAVVVLAAYLVGSIPMSYILGRVAKQIDIRSYGSGNVGASNAWVHVGKWTVVPVGAFDFLGKGSVPVLIALRLDVSPWIAVAAGVAALVGHNWSIYLKFTGGRGISVVVGVLLAMAFKELLAGALVVVAGWIVFRSSGLWVGIGIATLPIWSIVFGSDGHITALCVCLGVVVAAKRLLGNWNVPAIGDGGWRMYLHRLLYDRDVASRDEWVNRTPGESQESG